MPIRVVIAPAKVLASAAIVMTTGAAGPYFTINKTIVPTKIIDRRVSSTRLPPGEAHDWSQQYQPLHGHGLAGGVCVVIVVPGVLIRLLPR